MNTDFDPRYLRFFELFNSGEYFEAHEVLEGLWHETTDYRRDFYQGLIQIAAVLLKLKQAKLAPAARLADRALGRLAAAPSICEGLDVPAVRRLLEDVRTGGNPLVRGRLPELQLIL